MVVEKQYVNVELNYFKMKYLSILLIALLSAFQTDNLYNIIKVNGQIINTSTGKSLSAGDKVRPNDQLQFDSRLSSALAISSSRGKFSLKVPEGSDAFSDSKLLAVADNAVSPIKSRNQLSTRSIGNGLVKDLKSYFGADEFTIVGNTLNLKLDPDIYPLNENNFIVFSYMQDGKQVTKKIGFTDQQIKIEKDKLLVNVTDPHLVGVIVYQYNKTSNSPVEITKFNLNFVEADNLMKEFKAVVDVLNGMKLQKEDKTKYLTDYFVDIYGQTDQSQLSQLVNQSLVADK